LVDYYQLLLPISQTLNCTLNSA